MASAYTWPDFQPRASLLNACADVNSSYRFRRKQSESRLGFSCLEKMPLSASFNFSSESKTDWEHSHQGLLEQELPGRGRSER